MNRHILLVLVGTLFVVLTTKANFYGKRGGMEDRTLKEILHGMRLQSAEEAELTSSGAEEVLSRIEVLIQAWKAGQFRQKVVDRQVLDD